MKKWFIGLASAAILGLGFTACGGWPGRTAIVGDIDVDLLVVGTGIGGGITALSALEAGAGSVLLIDMMDEPGGAPL
ncbi:MAG: hypothetical protein FWG66_15585 [Spirochaetes bacterium]|nr:hypothetical protein [Spirochaetota bacterium]